MLLLLPKPAASRKLNSKKQWDNFLGNCHDWVFSHKKIVWGATVILLTFSIYSILQIKTNNYLTEELPRGDELRASFSFFEDHFGGARTFEAAVSPKDSNSSFWDYEILTQINAVDSFLVHYYGLKGVMSPAALTKELNQAMHGGDYNYRTFPTEEEFKKMKRPLRRVSQQPQIKELVNEEQRLARFRGNMKDEGGMIHLAKNDSLKKFIQIKAPDLEIHITGMPHLIDH